MYDIKKIVEIINKEGRQGPRDLKSDEVFGWVNRKMDISYYDYLKLLEENSISENERVNNRNAFFIKENNGKYQFFKSKEDEIRKYICYIVRENPGITSGETRKKVKIIYQDYTIIDLMDQKNLSSNQDVIDQTIRNIMVSNYDKKKNNILFNRTKDKHFKYTVTNEGLRLASLVDKILSDNKLKEAIIEKEVDFSEKLYLKEGSEYYSSEDLKLMHEKNKNFNFYNSYDVEKSKNGRIPTDSKLKTTALVNSNFKCEVNPKHKTFPSSIYPNFLEGHHMVPVSSQRNFKSINLDCIENIIALCPNCHAQIHYGTRDAKSQIFKSIIKSRGSDLLSIGFSEPILKVVFDTYY